MYLYQKFEPRKLFKLPNYISRRLNENLVFHNDCFDPKLCCTHDK